MDTPISRSRRFLARFRPEAVSGREVIGVWLDDLDDEYVVRYVAKTRVSQ